MRIANRVVIKVLAKPEDDAAKMKQGIVDLVPLEPDTYTLTQSKAQGFNERKIGIFEVVLTKVAHTNAFIKHLRALLTPEQQDVLLQQAKSRLDERFNYYIRIDKDAWINDRKLYLTDSGTCFHIRICLAVFPGKKEVALEAVRNLLSGR